MSHIDFKFLIENVLKVIHSNIKTVKEKKFGEKYAKSYQKGS